MTRKDVENWVQENEIELILLEGLDSAILGIADDGLPRPKVVYSKRGIFAALRAQGMSDEEANEWYAYNTVRAIPYMGEAAPIIMDDLWVDDSKVVN